MEAVVQPLRAPAIGHCPPLFTAQECEQVTSDAEALRDVYGARWVFVPHEFGARAAAAREILERGIFPIDIDRSDPVRVTQEVGEFARTTSVMTSRVLHETIGLTEAFGSDVATL